MAELKQIKSISLTVTIVNIIELVCSVLAVSFGIACINFSDEIAAGGEQLLESGREHDVVGGFELFAGLSGFFGGVVGMLIGVALICMGIAAFLYLLAPVIVGLTSFFKSGKRLSESEELYITKYKSDGIVKAVFNGIPAVILFISSIREALTFNINVLDFGILAVLIAVFGVSVYQVTLCKKLLG